jgi:hypothetical protein
MSTPRTEIPLPESKPSSQALDFPKDEERLARAITDDERAASLRSLRKLSVLERIQLMARGPLKTTPKDKNSL